jgi:isoamylase
VWLNGDAITPPGPHGEHVTDDDFLLLFNANLDPMRFSVPKGFRASKWQKVVDTSATDLDEVPIEVRRPVTVPGFTLLVLQRES